MPRGAVCAGQIHAARVAVSGRPDRCRSVRSHLGPMILGFMAPRGRQVPAQGRQVGLAHQPMLDDSPGYRDAHPPKRRSVRSPITSTARPDRNDRARNETTDELVTEVLRVLLMCTGQEAG
jgi:hypothetical protein